jgi:hypothetical protein
MAQWGRIDFCRNRRGVRAVTLAPEIGERIAQIGSYG